jgi:HAD superfamily hydrolase (TIGR01509 family)
MMPRDNPYGADALLFDLGRVIIDIDFSLALARWAEHARGDRERLVARFSHDDAYKRHEIGAIDEAAYFAALAATLDIDMSSEQWLDGWNAIFVGEMPGMADLLAAAARYVPLYAFTNSNRAHERYWSSRFAGVLGHFRKVFVSSTIGLRKPDAEAFDHVVGAIGIPAARILFFDDNLENVHGARARGLQTVHVTSVADIAEVLAGPAAGPHQRLHDG